MGFTTKFSCDGLRDTVQQVLVALGAPQEGTEHPLAGLHQLQWS